MKGQRLSGTCYNGTHWLNKEDCSICNMKEQCITLNTRDAERRSKVSHTPVVIKQEPRPVHISLTKIIEHELLAGGDILDIISRVQKVTNAPASKIQSWIKGFRKAIHDHQGKWSKYTDVSTIDGQLRIVLK